ncbi:hypothetical protein MP638_002261 [Amoeboaphelidium occidentale]|nr:hypothetical protein MP638_002261 [Amoeboaphelidium occidentale]
MNISVCNLDLFVSSVAGKSHRNLTMGHGHSKEEEQNILQHFDAKEAAYLRKVYDGMVDGHTKAFRAAQFKVMFPHVPDEVASRFPLIFANLEYLSGAASVSAKLTEPRASGTALRFVDVLKFTSFVTDDSYYATARAIHILWNISNARSLESWARKLIKIEMTLYKGSFDELKLPEQLSDAFIHRILSGKDSDPLPSSAHGAAAQFLLQHTEKTIDYKTLDLKDVSKFVEWVGSNNYIRRIIENFFIRIFAPPKAELNTTAATNSSPTTTDQMPQKTQMDKKLAKQKARKFLLKPPLFLTKAVPDFMTVEDVWFLHFHLHSDFCTKWFLAYDSLRDGHAFNPFIDRITMIGSTLIIVKDKDNHYFGCFAEKEWDVRPEWYGTSNNFLFQLRPSFSFYPASSFNTNYQYFEYGTHTLPNGLGMGGQFDYFGFFLSADFIHGHSKANPVSSTFQNPTLSGQEEFLIDKVYAIRVKEISKQTLDRERALRASGKRAQKQEVLEFLDMAGIKTYSKQVGALEEREDSD